METHDGDVDEELASDNFYEGPWRPQMIFQIWTYSSFMISVFVPMALFVYTRSLWSLVLLVLLLGVSGWHEHRDPYKLERIFMWCRYSLISFFRSRFMGLPTRSPIKRRR